MEERREIEKRGETSQLRIQDCNQGGCALLTSIFDTSSFYKSPSPLNPLTPTATPASAQPPLSTRRCLSHPPGRYPSADTTFAVGLPPRRRRGVTILPLNFLPKIQKGGLKPWWMCGGIQVSGAHSFLLQIRVNSLSALARFGVCWCE